MKGRPVHYTNYEQHHKQRSYLVFYFYSREPADRFEQLLKSEEIPFERGSGQDLIRRHLFGIHKHYEEQAKSLNDSVNAQFRKPFLSDSGARMAVLVITALAVIIALAGWLLSK